MRTGADDDLDVVYLTFWRCPKIAFAIVITNQKIGWNFADGNCIAKPPSQSGKTGLPMRTIRSGGGTVGLVNARTMDGWLDCSVDTLSSSDKGHCF